MRKVIFFGCVSLVFTTGLMAQELEPKAIIGLEAEGNTIYLYNDAFDQIGEMKGSELRPLLESTLEPVLQMNGKTQERGILIQQYNPDEGMYQIEVAGKGPVWVEKLAFKVWPDREIVCPASVLGQTQETQEDGTVGFGGC